MGVTIQFERQNPELWAIVVMDRDESVLEFFEQPDIFKIRYLDKSGKKMGGHYYTPDFLVLRNDSVCFEEWKREDDLKQLATRYPFRYQLQEDGSWRCPPAEEAVSALGLTFRVRSSAELHSTYVDNLLFLEDYFDMTLAVPVQVQTTILQRLRETPGLPLSALAFDGSGVRANDVYAMLALDLLYTDLAAPLIQHGLSACMPSKHARTHAHLLPTRLASRVGSPFPEGNAPLTVNTQLLWDGRAFTLINPGDTTTTLLPEKGALIQIPSDFFFQLLDTGVITRLRAEEDLPVSPEGDRLMDRATPEDQRQAVIRFEKVMAYLSGEKERYAGVPPRTLHRWVARFREAEEQFGSGYVGLLSRKASQGNREPKAPSAPRELMDTFITEQFETPRHMPAASVYRAYEQECRKRGLTALSARAFYQRIKQRATPEQTEARAGARAAYPEQPWFWEITETTPRYGSRPFEVAHIDHTELDIQIRSSSTGELLGKPWVTFMMEAYSRRLLAVYLTFDPPSYRSVMMVLRICVQRYARLPQSVVVDGGREFHSVYFDSLLARYRCTKKTRPWAKPHFGSVCEREASTVYTTQPLERTEPVGGSPEPAGSAVPPPAKKTRTRKKAEVVSGGAADPGSLAQAEEGVVSSVTPPKRGRKKKKTADEAGSPVETAASSSTGSRTTGSRKQSTCKTQTNQTHWRTETEALSSRRARGGARLIASLQADHMSPAVAALAMKSARSVSAFPLLWMRLECGAIGW